MGERRQAAWDEAQRRYPTGDRQAGFVSGAAWADEKAHRAAEATDPGEVRCGFRAGARWQREALLSDEAAERVADVLEALDGDDFITVARAALSAALGKGENDE